MVELFTRNGGGGDPTLEDSSGTLISFHFLPYLLDKRSFSPLPHQGHRSLSSILRTHLYFLPLFSDSVLSSFWERKTYFVTLHSFQNFLFSPYGKCFFDYVFLPLDDDTQATTGRWRGLHRPPQDVLLWHVNFFELKASKTQLTQQKPLPLT